MAYAFTVSGTHSSGDLKEVHGTFTSAAGDSTGTLTATTHGLNYIAFSEITFDTGGINTQTPKKTISSGTITFVVDDALGYSGKWTVKGR
ncbi:MAG: hypothetical protein KAS32_29730 [Candidatus Peribacteraceae bacterium]|nr:hypothetical protein [Candidatus Peribacteraceae bacterium]